jgi:hypothetical protein
MLTCYLVWGSRIMRPSGATKSVDNRFEPDHSFKGRIVVTIIERKTGPEKKLEFLIDLDRGKVESTSGPQFEGPLSPGGRIDYCEHQGPIEVPAPNHALAASCGVELDKNSRRYVVRILKLGSNEPVREWLANEGSEICGLIWSADSRSVAVLLEEEKKDLGPLGLLSAASGHPVPLESFRVTLFSAQSEDELRLPVIRRDSPSGWARIDWTQ